MKDLTEIKLNAIGVTTPFIDSGTSILLIQDGNVSVGKLIYDLNDADSVYIDHPTNEDELNSIAAKEIKDLKPEYLNSQDSIIVTCPKYIELKMQWDDNNFSSDF